MCEGLNALLHRLDILALEKDHLITHLAFLKVSTEAGAGDKFSNSYSGHVVKRLIRGAAQLAVLTIERIWDPKEVNPISICGSAYFHVEALVKEKHEEFPQRGDAEAEIARNKLSLEIIEHQGRLFNDSHLRRRIRIYRTEELAHNLKGISNERRRFGKDIDVLSVTIDDVMKAAEQTIEVVDELVRILCFRHESSGRSMGIQMAYAKMFWSALPVLSKVEDTSFLDEIGA